MNNLKMVSPTTPRKTKIFVGRLPENCRSDELRNLFVRFGEVTECDVMNRYGFVHMAREEDAAEAIKNLHNTVFKGATINVEQSAGKSRGRRDERRGGPMRGRGGGRDGGRDTRPGGYGDYNRGGGDFGGRGDFGGGGGYNDRGYGQNMGGGGQNMGYQSQPMAGYGPTGGGGGGGYGPAAGVDYGRNDYGRNADFTGRADYGNRTDFQSGGGMGGDFNRAAPPQGPVEYGRSDNFAGNRADAYAPRADYDRNAGPMRNGSGGVAAAGYNTGYAEVGYTEGYERADPYGPPQRAGRFPGPADAMPPRY